MFDLALFGIITGFISGFFGVGGGMVLVPMLLFAQYSMKEAVSISIMQMVFSSLYGSFLNYQKNKTILKDGFIIGLGGFLGGLQNSFIHTLVSNTFLEVLFIFIVLFAIYRISFSSPHGDESKKTYNPYMLFCIGFVIGMIAMSIGVGGAVMLTPILVSYLFYNIKDASSLGLFFVIFSSIAGFLSLSFSGEMLYTQGGIVGIASLFGVFAGVKVKHLVNIKNYKYFILTMYVLIVSFMLYKFLNS